MVRRDRMGIKKTQRQGREFLYARHGPIEPRSSPAMTLNEKAMPECSLNLAPMHLNGLCVG